MRIFSVLFTLILLAVSVSGCRRSHTEIWEDTKTASRHMGRGLRSIGGKHGDSRQVHSRDDFFPDNFNPNNFNYEECEFIPLQDEAGSDRTPMYSVRQPEETPGDPGSSVPGIHAFQDPSCRPELARVFQNVHFELNSNLVKGQQNLETIHRIADYMKGHPNTYIFVEGHCCDRGPAAFNLSLGSRRANNVRNLLVNEGVNPDRIFTVSYGKERPLVIGSDEQFSAMNRRAQFKIYER